MRSNTDVVVLFPKYSWLSSQAHSRIAFLYPLRLGVRMRMSLKCVTLIEAVRASICWARLCPSGACLAFKKVVAILTA